VKDRLWKKQLQELVYEALLTITETPPPPATAALKRDQA